MRATIVLLSLALAGCGSTHADRGQEELHPTKQATFEGMEAWPATSPGSVTLRSFRPFRAVYERHYIQGSGPQAGEPRADRVIIHAESVGWDGRPAVAIQLIDSGDPKWSDTNGRTMSMYAAQDDLSVLFEIGPIPGKAKDYYVSRRNGDEGVVTRVDSAAGESQSETVPLGGPGFGPGAWALASMDLEPGRKIRLDPIHSPPTTILGARFGHVVGPTQFVDVSGNSHEAVLVESPGRASSPRVTRYYLVDRPPYLLARFSFDNESGKEFRGTRLVSFTALD